MTIAQPSNDSCHQARVLTNLNNGCIQFVFQNATFDTRSGSCIGVDLPNTWFQFVAQGTDVEIEVNSGATPTITLFDVDQNDICNDTLWDEELCAQNILALGSRLEIGRTYLFSVAFQSAGIGNYVVCINNPEPPLIPVNDDPCFAPLVIPDGSCYNGYNTMSTEDWPNPDCSNDSRASVWYRTFLTPGHNGLEVTLDPGFTGNYSMYIARFNENRCRSFPIIVGDTILCDNSPDQDTITFTNLSANQLYYIQIASKSNATGTFSFCITELDDPSGCGLNDDCLSASDISVPSPEPDTLCFTGCNRSALPGPMDMPGTCYFMENPTVWHEITPDFTAAAIRIVMSSTELTFPHIAVYTGDTCSDLTPVLCDFSATGFLDFAIFDLIAGNKYYVAVTDLMGNEGEYDICVDQFEFDGINCKLISSLRPIETSFGSPLDGPYQSEESVTFCYQISAWQKVNCNYLQGIVPRFGTAWDASSFKMSGEPVNVPVELEPHVPGTWRWYEEGEVTYKINNADKGYPAGTPLPGGWYFTNNAVNGTNPNFSRGDSDNCDIESGVTWEVCFALTVKPFNDCLLLDDDDASIRIEAFGDSEIGAWGAAGCLTDPPSLYVGEVRCCEGPETDDASFTLCDGGMFEYNLNPTNDPDLNFSWTVVLPDGTFGANSGTGNVISDVLRNFTLTRQNIQYLVSTANSEGCFGAPATINVEVQPRILVDAGENITGCQGLAVRLGGMPTATGGSGNYIYRWSDGLPNDDRPIIIVDQTQFYGVTVTDSRGCRDTDSVFVRALPSATTSIESQICPGESIMIGNEIITEAGEYTVVFGGAASNGCDSIITASISVSEIISIQSEMITPDRGTLDGAITIGPTGGQPPYDITWSNGQSGATITALRFGFYTATVRDANDCVQEFTFEVPLMSGNINTALKESIRVFPNPLLSGNEWTIQNAQAKFIESVSIYTVDGKLIVSTAIQSSNQIIPQPGLQQTGLYIVEIATDEGLTFEKLMISTQ